MSERVIVIEQRLRSTGVALGISAILAVFVAASLFLFLSSASVSMVPLAIDVVVFLGLAGVCLLFVRVIVRIVQMPEGRALEIVYGPGGLVRQVFEPHELIGADAREYSFMHMGGWGYRGSLRLLRQAALVTRRGSALEVHLTRKRRFVVTVDDPEDFVTALQLPT